MTNKACVEKKTELYCGDCRAPSTVRHPRDKKATRCPLCGQWAIVESIQEVMGG